MYLKGIYGSIRYSIIVGTFFLVFKAQDKDIYTNGKSFLGSYCTKLFLSVIAGIQRVC